MPENSPSSLVEKRIVITRALTESEDLARELTRRGAIPVVFPLVSFSQPEDFGPLDKAIDDLAAFDWVILTSVRAARAVVARASESGRPLRPRGSHWRAGCVGPVTAEAAKLAGFPVAHVATTHNGVALAEELGSQLAGAKILLPRSDRANPDLPAALKRFGADVTEVIAYRTVTPADVNRSALGEVAFGKIDALLFFSPTAIKHFGLVSSTNWRSLSGLQNEVAITAVGPVTAKALREAGVERLVIASDTTAASVIEALEKHFAAAKVAPAGAKQA